MNVVAIQVREGLIHKENVVRASGGGGRVRKVQRVGKKGRKHHVNTIDTHDS